MSFLFDFIGEMALWLIELNVAKFIFHLPG